MAINITIDVDSRNCVDAANQTLAIIPPFFQGEIPTVNLFFVQMVLGSYVYQNYSGYIIRVGLADDQGLPSGSPATTLIAYATSWARITSPNEGVTGSLDLTSEAVANFLSTLATKNSTLEVEVMPPAGTRSKILQVQVTIKAAVLSVAPDAVIPQPSYITVEESNAIFMPLKGDGAWLQIGSDKQPYIYSSDDGMYAPLYRRIVNGNQTFEWGTPVTQVP
jgi:hypothetical protein